MVLFFLFAYTLLCDKISQKVQLAQRNREFV